MKLLTNEQQKSYQKVNICYICKEKFEDEFIKDKKYREVRDHFHDTSEHRGSVLSICNLMYRVPKYIPIIFHDGSNYDYHFVIKEIVQEFDGQFNCLGKNTEKYINFSIPTKKEVLKTDRNEGEITKAVCYRLQFTDKRKIFGNFIIKHCQ